MGHLENGTLRAEKLLGIKDERFCSQVRPVIWVALCILLNYSFQGFVWAV